MSKFRFKVAFTCNSGYFKGYLSLTKMCAQVIYFSLALWMNQIMSLHLEYDKV